MKKHLFLKSLLVLIGVLLTSLTTQVWGSKGFFDDGQWNVQYYYTGSSNTWMAGGYKNGSTQSLGIMTTFYLKGCWVKTWGDENVYNVKFMYGYTDHSESGNKTMHYDEGDWSKGYKGDYTWTFDNVIDYNVIANAPNSVGPNTLWVRWSLDGDAVTSGTSYINFTIPGFTTTSTSQTIISALSSNNSETISFGQHYGTALTTSNCSITGTNASEFSVTSISETGVTVRFTPSSAGEKTATLTITDAHSKTCTITLTGKSKVLVTYMKGSASGASGSDVTDDKVYGIDLTLKDKGSFSLTGYDQTAWNTNSNGTSGTSYSLKGTYSSESAITLYPTWSAHTYNITLDKGTGGTANGSATVTYNTTALASKSDATKTGYSLTGYYTAASEGTKVLNADGSFAGTNIDGYITSGKWTKAADCTLYAQWTANTYTITFHLNGGDSWGSLGSATESAGTVTLQVTYDQVLNSLTLPHAIKNAYHFDTWSTSSTYSSAAIWKYDYSVEPRIYHWYAYAGYVTKVGANYYWKRAGNVDLYAYYDAPELHNLSFSPANVVPEGDVTATVTFSSVMGEPEGTYVLCYKLTTAAGVALVVQPEWKDQDDAAHTVSFAVPASPGEYSLGIKLFPGSSASWDDPGHSFTFDGNTTNPSCACSTYKFEVESMNTVTVSYKSGGVDLRPSTTANATWSNPATLTAPDIPGMEFVNWTFTGSVYLKTGYVATDKTVEVRATGTGTATANYNQGSLFFKDTKGWVENPETDSIYVYFYSTTAYWTTSTGNSEGTGSNKSFNSAFHSGPFAMTLLEGTDDVYYYAGDAPAYAAVAFSKEKMKNYDYFAGSEANPCNVVYVNSFNSSKPMIVPVGNGAIWNIKKARYYAHDLAPLLPDWGYDLRGDNDYIGWSPATDADKHKMVAPRLGDLSFSTDIYFDNALDNKEWKIYNGTKGYGRSDNQKLTYSSQTSGVLTNYDASGYNLKIQTNIAGNYTFTLNFGTDCSEATYSGAKVSDANGLMGHMTVKITYPVAPNDFRLVYTGGSKPHPGNVVKKRANGEDIVSMYVASGKSSYLKVQPCSSASASSVSWTALGSCSAPTYADGVNFATILSEGGPGTYNFTITQDENKVAKITKVEKYTGNFYIRTDCVNSDKWNFWKSKNDHEMTYTEYSTTLKTDPYSHYFVKWISGDNVIVKYCVANDYSYAISDTLDTDDVLTSGPNVKVSATNVRFTYNQETNTLKRAYTYGPSNNKYMLLRTKYVTSEDGTNAHLYKSWTSTSVYTLLGGTNISLDGAAVDTLIFKDNGNWVYQADVYARPGAPIKLTGYFNGATQYFKGTTGTAYATDGVSPDAEKLMGGTGNPQHMRITYDFKTNRMMTAWIPSSDVTGELDINADIMLLRREQEGATSITFGENGKLEDVKTAYGVMEFRKSYINDYSLPRFERNLYWISFPFDVNLSDVFGFGKYGEHWIIELYDGKGRAEKGYWAESEPNWKFVTEEIKDEFVLKANEGYILALALSNMGEYSSVWEGGKISSVHLYFPSAHEIGSLADVDEVRVEMDTVGYKCKITRDSRDIKDSYWHCIGAPSYAQSTRTGLPTTKPANWETKVPYVYTWNSINNSLDITSSSSVDFLAMHSYLVQYPDDVLVWTDVTNTPSSIVRRRVEGHEAGFYEWKLNLLRNGEQIDHTYVRMTNDENATENFDFGQDISKEFNSGANIYSFVEGVQVAGNVMPIDLNTTKVVPVGIKTTEVAEYTFSMPEGTNGISVVLVDNETGERTNLSLTDYTVNLEAGQYDGRFSLEIAPIAYVPTDIDLINGENGANSVRKVMVDGMLYIVRDGEIYDAQGKRIK